MKDGTEIKGSGSSHREWFHLCETSRLDMSRTLDPILASLAFLDPLPLENFWRASRFISTLAYHSCWTAKLSPLDHVANDI